jgi:uncharacterized protein (TIGR00255 family)
VRPVLRSMTGYGRNEILRGSQHLVIEIRSINNRFIEVQVKAPRSFAALEPRLKKLVQEHCSRGRFDLFVSRTGEREAPGKIVVDESLADQYVAVLRGLKERYGLAGDPDVSQVSLFPGLISVTEDTADIEALWQALSAGMESALRDLNSMRAAEGSALARDMAGRLDAIEGLMQKVDALSPASVEQARKRMTEAVGRLLGTQPDPARIAQEIAVLAERTDITEELTRLGSHLVQFRSMISGGTTEPVGRKLDFLLQEMGREANTIASKAMHASISQHVVDIKAELEKIREQVQNIE